MTHPFSRLLASAVTAMIGIAFWAVIGFVALWAIGAAFGVIVVGFRMIAG